MFFSKIFGDYNERYLKKLKLIIEKINSLENDFEKLTNEEMKTKTAELKKRVAENGELEAALAEAFALVREAAKRTLGQRHYDVQLLGGIVLHQGKIAEMKTGEGKTLVATLAAYLNALENKGVHIVTVNDYLARRDTVWMGQIYHLLGLSASCITHEASYIYDPTHIKNPKSEIRQPEVDSPLAENLKQSQNSNNQNSKEDELDKLRDLQGSFKVVHEFLRPCSRKEAYLADITYGTNNEFGFDYLRDNMTANLEQISQRPHHFAIVDEVDSILIDEARTPLIISVHDEESNKMYEQFAKLVNYLKEGIDYNVDEKMRTAAITNEGISKVEQMLGVKNIYDPSLEDLGFRYLHHLEQALRAYAIFRKDKDYVIKNGEVIIVDEFTGRLMPGRRFSGGLHQALEAKEGVLVQKESRTFASITFQNYFRLYKKLSGMTGTALTSAEEFHKVYNLEVIALPTNKPLIRRDLPDLVFKTEKGKFRAVVAEIKKRHEAGQPILVGTISIEKNEELSALLKKENIPHEILNAKNHEREGAIIAQTGKFKAVTIATNMAGRGVDIILGGYPPADAEPRELNAELRKKKYQEWQEEQRKIRELEGLFVIGTERHEARRIDNQLRGRSGRQGDSGETQFFVSLEDDLMRIFGSDKIKKMMETFGIPEDQPIEASLVSRAIEAAQAKIEGHNFDARKYVLEYDEVMNKHREAVYKMRREILAGENLKTRTLNLIKEEIIKIVDVHTKDRYPADWNLEEIFEDLKIMLPITDEIHQKLKDFETSEEMKNYLIDLEEKLYEAKETAVGFLNMREIEKFVSLRTIDMFWMDHLEAMEYLRDSVRLRAYGQHDPLVEYKNEGVRLFKDLISAINQNIVFTIFKVGLVRQPAVSFQQSDQAILNKKNLEAGSRKSMTANRKVGRNDPCPCGSGKKYKKCHMTQG